MHAFGHIRNLPPQRFGSISFRILDAPMPKQDNSTDEIVRLQEQTMRQLDSISKDIESGFTTVEAGSKRAAALVQESQAKSSILARERAKQVQRRKLGSWLLLGVALLSVIAYFIVTNLASASWPAIQ